MPVFHDSFYAMGTRLDLVIPDTGPEEGRLCADEIRAEVGRLERRLSRFDGASAVSTLNEEAGLRSAKADEEIIHILKLCLSYYESTKGAFDITMAPLRTLWEERATQIDGSPPTSREIAAAQKATGADKLEIDTNNHSVRFLHPDLKIDLGGFGKGYALERVGEILDGNGKKNAFVCFGDSAVLGCGRHPHGTHWEIGVKHLFDQARSVRSFRLSNQSLSTSGTTPNNIQAAASWYSHLISPRSGRPIVGYRTVSVVAPSALDAEVLSTALAATPVEERDGISHSIEGLQAVEFIYGESREPVLRWSSGFSQNH